MAVVLSNHCVGLQMLILRLCFHLITGWQHAACELAPLCALPLGVTVRG